MMDTIECAVNKVYRAAREGGGDGDSGGGGGGKGKGKAKRGRDAWDPSGVYLCVLCVRCVFVCLRTHHVLG